jgi:hypothetical protein
VTKKKRMNLHNVSGQWPEISGQRSVASGFQS